MNEILVLERKGDPDDDMVQCFTGVINANHVRIVATCGEQRRAEDFILQYLRKTGKAIEDYKSTEEVLRSFLEYCRTITLEPVKE